MLLHPLFCAFQVGQFFFFICFISNANEREKIMPISAINQVKNDGGVYAKSEPKITKAEIEQNNVKPEKIIDAMDLAGQNNLYAIKKSGVSFGANIDEPTTTKAQALDKAREMQRVCLQHETEISNAIKDIKDGSVSIQREAQQKLAEVTRLANEKEDAAPQDGTTREIIRFKNGSGLLMREYREGETVPYRITEFNGKRCIIKEEVGEDSLKRKFYGKMYEFNNDKLYVYRENFEEVANSHIKIGKAMTFSGDKLQNYTEGLDRRQNGEKRALEVQLGFAGFNYYSIKSSGTTNGNYTCDVSARFNQESGRLDLYTEGISNERYGAKKSDVEFYCFDGNLILYTEGEQKLGPKGQRYKKSIGYQDGIPKTYKEDVAVDVFGFEKANTNYKFD